MLIDLTEYYSLVDVYTSIANTIYTTKTIHIGAVTHIQDQLTTPTNFRIRNNRNITINGVKGMVNLKSFIFYLILLFFN